MKTFLNSFIIGFIWSLFVLFIAIPSIALNDTGNEPITFEKIQQLYQGERNVK